jgi:sugar phosphate isomerase/epimerase
MKLLQRLLLLAALTLLSGSLRAEDAGDRIAIQTWTLRNMDFDQVVKFAVDHKVKYLQMIDKHINPKGSMDEIRKKKAVLDQNGLVCYTFGVAGTSLNKDDNRKLFEFAKFMGIKLIVVEPPDFQIFDNLEELVKEYDIKVAIHNHGIKSLYGNPLVVRNVIKHRDPRIGVCLDVGWVTAAGFDAAKIFSEYEGRVFDIHLKDKKIEKTQGDDVATDTMIGEGQTNLKGLLAQMKKANYSGHMAIETDSNTFAREPASFVDGAIKFVHDNP